MKGLNKRIAILLIITMLLNMFSPYSSLFNQVQAASDTVPNPVVVFNKIQNITEKSGNKFFKVQVAVVNNVNLNGFDLKFSYDSTKIQPANKTSGKAATAIGMISETYPDMADGSYGTRTYDTSTKSYRLTYAKGGGHDLEELGYAAGEGWDDVYEGYDTWAENFDYYLPIVTYTFRLVDTSLTDDDITTDLFNLVPVTGSLPTGNQIVYLNTSGIEIAYDIDKITGVGFAEAAKTVSSIALKNMPNKTNYEHGDTIDLTGGSITVTYDDGSSEDVDMLDSNVKLTSGNTADVNNQNVVLNYLGKTLNFTITVTDPVKSLKITSPMTKIEYDHGESFDFTGLKLTATKKSGATESLQYNSQGVSISENTASVNSNNFTALPDDGTGVKKGTQKITFTYEGQKAEATVTVNDTINSVELISQPTKTVYKYGESLDLTGAKLKVSFGSGNTTTINLPDGNVAISTYSNTTIGVKQNLTATYGGKTATKTIDVEVYNYVDRANLTDPNKVTYKYGEELDLTGGKLTLYMKDGDVTDVNLTSAMISGYNKKSIGQQNLTVSYDAKYTLSDGSIITDTITKNLQVEVENAVNSITITAPTKTKYNHGDSLDLTGGIIKVKYENGTEENRTMTTAMITEADGSTVNMSPTNYGNTNKISKTLKIEYTEDGKTGTVNYPIEIVNSLKSISLNGTPKTSYNVNESLETGLSITVNRENGNTETIAVTPDMISGFDTTTEGSKTATISYTENGVTKTTKLNYTVADSVTGITIKTKPSKTEYKYQEPLDITGGTISVIKGSGTKDIAITQDMVSGYDAETLGKQTITITYGGQTATYDVNVKDYIKGITVAPNTVTGKYNDELSSIINDNNITYTVTYAKAGAKTPVALAESMVTGYSKTNVAQQSLTITYTDTDTNSATNGQDFTASLKVTLSNPTASISMKQQPSKIEYGYGDTIDLSGGTITITKENGDTEEKALTDSDVTVTETDGSAVDLSKVTFGQDQTATKNLKVTYDGKDTTFTVKVINKVTKIDMHTTPKTNYNVKDALDLTTNGTTPGEILVTRQTGTPEVIAMNDSRVNVTGFDSNTEHTDLPLTVTFTENGVSKTTTYKVNVKDTVTAVTLKVTPSKTNYKYNEELDVTGGRIEITKGSGKTTIDLEASMVSGYDKTKLGDQTLTITYGGQTTTYKVNVKDYITGITVAPNTVTGNNGTELADLINANSIKYTVTYAKAGAKTPTALTESMVAGYNKESITDQNLTITYTDTDTNSATNGQNFTANLKVTLNDKVTAITITAPTKTKYNHGDSLDLTGSKIKVTTKSGKEKDVALTSSMITEADGSTVNMSPDSTKYGSDNTLNKVLKITYTEDGKTVTENYTITIVNDVKSISIQTPAKTTYNVNDTLDISQGEILVTRATGTPTVIAMTDSRVNVTGFDSNTEHTDLPLTVTFTENGVSKTTTYKVNVKDTVTAVTLKVTPSKTNYKYNEELDVTGGRIEITKGSGKTTIDLEASMVSGYDKTKLGDQTLTITYGGQTTTYKVNVKDYITGITVAPNTVTGNNGTELADLINANSIKYTVTYAKAGAKTPTALTESMVTGYNKESTTDQNLTITYTDTDTNSATNGQDFTASLKVTLSNPTASISMKQQPSKIEYGYGDTIDLSGGTITITKENGDTEEKALTDSDVTVTETDGSAVDLSKVTFGQDQTATKNLKVTYDGKDTTFTVKVINKVTKIDMHTTPKTNYNVKDALDLTTNGTTPGEILVTRQTGTPEVIAMNDSRVNVTGFDSNTEHTDLPLTVTFTENGVSKTTTYKVNVKDTVTAVTLKVTPSKTNYKYNEELDVTGGRIEITKGSGKTTIDLEASMVSGYDKTKLGDQTLTITYGGQTTTYKVNVKDYITGITVAPNTVTGNNGTELADLINANSIKYTVTYAKAGAKTPTALTESMVTGYNKESTTDQNLTITYTDTDTNSATNGQNFTANLKVTLKDEIVGISIKKKPSKIEYGYGEALDTSGGIITITKKSGKTEEKGFNETGITITDTNGNNIDLTTVVFDSNHKATKTIQINYEGKKVTYDVNITNQIKGILMQDLPKTKYNVNDTLDLTTDGTNPGTIKVTRQNNETEIVKLDNASIQVTGFDSSVENTNLQLTVSYTENGITKKTSYTVSVTDKILNAELLTTPKTQYKYGETLDVSTGKIKITRSSGEEIIAIKPNMVTEQDGTPFNGTKLGTRNLNVTYGGKVMTYEVTVSDYVKGVILTPPTKVKYEYGESLNLTGGTIQKVMASGAATSPVALSDSSVTLSGYNPNHEGAQTIEVTYEGFTERFGVIVEDNIQSIVINSLPTKIQYKYGEPLSVAGGKILATKSSGKTEIIDITTSMVTGYETNKLGNQVLTVTYKGKTATYTVNVEDYIKDISIVKPNKLIYKLNESIDLTGGQVKPVMASGATTSAIAMANADVIITGFDSSKEGAKTIKVTYKGFTKTFGITVMDNLSGMIIKTLPDKLDYRYGESLDLTGGTIEVEKESGLKEVLDMKNSMITGYNPKTLGDQTLTVTYKGFTQQFIVKVEDYVSGLKIKEPSKLDYEYGEYLDLAGGKVSIVMASGKIAETTEMTASMVSGFNSKQEGKQTIKVEYKNLQGKFQVKVVDKIKGISMNSEPDKIQYNYGENIDLTGASIAVVKSSGTTIMKITSNMISGYSATTPGTQIITVTYGGFTTKFIVVVGEKPEEPKQQEIINKTEEKPSKPAQQEHVKINKGEKQQEEIINNQETKEEVKQEENNTKTPDTKPTETLGVKDEKDKDEDTDKKDETKTIAGITGGIGLLILILLLALKRNVKVYVEEDDKFVLGGLDKVSKKHKYIDIDKYLDGNTYGRPVKIVLSDSISDKLDGQEIEIKHRGNKEKYQIVYDDKPFEIVLK